MKISTAPGFFASTPAAAGMALTGLRVEAAKSNAVKIKTGPGANAVDGGLDKTGASRNASHENGATHRSVGSSTFKPRRAEFHLRAPSAKSVKLAADFTEWEKFPLDLVRSADGDWHTVVPLPPGNYGYRFIVDGRWCDDPHRARRAHHDSFGTAIAEVEVT